MTSRKKKKYLEYIINLNGLYKSVKEPYRFCFLQNNFLISSLLEVQGMCDDLNIRSLFYANIKMKKKKKCKIGAAPESTAHGSEFLLRGNVNQELNWHII